MNINTLYHLTISMSVCEKCGKKFASQSNLKKHSQRKTPCDKKKTNRKE